MKAQSVSIVVPAKKCINNCPFCVSRMHGEEYPNYMDPNDQFFDLRLKDYLKRLEFCRNNGINTVMLTGNSEPQQNRTFLTFFGIFNQMLKSPFENIEMQTTGTLLDRNYLRFLRNHVGVTTISISLSSFNDEDNNAIIRPPKDIILKELCSLIKEYGFILRLSLNMNMYLHDCFQDPKDSKDFRKCSDILFKSCKDLEADQITIRVLYTSGNNTIQDEWIYSNNLSEDYLNSIPEYVKSHAKPIRILEYGQTLYDFDSMSVVVDNDCMNEEVKEDLKYTILRGDCKLYSNWASKLPIF